MKQPRQGCSVTVLMMTVAATILFTSMPATAFPPYRTTDADTADPHTLELRLGLIKVNREGSETEIVAPLLRANYGLPGKLEFITELEYLPDDGAMGDGAMGGKWVPIFGGTTSFGIETLAQLPVRPGDSGTGVESQLLMTYWSERVIIHVNGGGFHDGRGAVAETGWRASVLAEFPQKRMRPGLELFAKQAQGEATDVRAGIGIIANLGKFDVRSGLHVGLTSQAPDLSFNLWISTSLPFQ